jgi:DNA-binding transcriptional regulator YbjK
MEADQMYRKKTVLIAAGRVVRRAGVAAVLHVPRAVAHLAPEVQAGVPVAVSTGLTARAAVDAPAWADVPVPAARR